MSFERIDPEDRQRPPILRFERDGQGFLVPMQSSRLVIGRGADCDVVLTTPDRRLSRRHLLLQRRGRRVVATNLGRNPARLNDSPLAGGARELLRGDRLRLGPWTVAVELDPGGTEASTAPPPAVLVAPTIEARHGLVGASAAMDRLREDIDRLGPLEEPVLLLGETGSGKERVAQALHEASARRRGPFVAVNCGALLGDTARSEIFGHARNAFTGADRARPGAFVEADGGTVFLDEIGELSGDLQAALLRTLDQGEVVPVGSVKPLRPDVRVLAATHRDLHGMDGFRQDLLYRLDVAQISLPPLRERLGDVPLLAEHFLGASTARTPPALGPGALAVLMAHSWPGNVRELRSTLLRAGVAAGGGLIEPAHISLRAPRLPQPATADWPVAAEPGPEWMHRPERERQQLIAALDLARGNRSRAARILGIARSTLYERLRRHGLLKGVGA
jgi:DNA-binding NtrC family response regulator